jgi:hypothetical protein
VWVLAEAAADWTSAQAFVQYGSALAVALPAIGYLRHELSKAQTRNAALAEDRLALAKASIPVLERTTEAVRASTAVIERHSSALGEASSVLAECRRTLDRATWVLERFDSPPRQPGPS